MRYARRQRARVRADSGARAALQHMVRRRRYAMRHYAPFYARAIMRAMLRLPLYLPHPHPSLTFCADADCFPAMLISLMLC